MNRLPKIRRNFVIALLTLIVAVMLPAATLASGGWYAEYFPNRDLSGAPAVVRTDPNLDFNWGAGSPDAQIPADNFSARWTQSLYLEEGQYEFNVTADDGVRLFVDGGLVINDWRESTNATRTGSIQLGAGTHTLRLEYFEQTGQAAVRLGWERKPIVRLIGNIITYAEPGTWVRIYRRMPNGEWQYMNPGGTGPIDASGRIKVDGLPVEPFYGDRGQPYRVELWTQGRILRTVGDTDNGQPEFIVYPSRDNVTPWGPPAATPQSTPTPSPTPRPDGSGAAEPILHRHAGQCPASERAARTGSRLCCVDDDQPQSGCRIDRLPERPRHLDPDPRRRDCRVGQRILYQHRRDRPYFDGCQLAQSSSWASHCSMSRGKTSTGTFAFRCLF